jgi:hypothetical protein
MKTCFKCNKEKPLTDFYKHKKMSDGHLNKCKECTKNDVKENVLKNPEYYREYEQKRSMLPHRIAARLKYSQTENGIKALQKGKEKFSKSYHGKESIRKSKTKWIEENVIKRAAHIILGNAVRDGKIQKPIECSACGSKPSRLHGHHDDYAFPLIVRWLCSRCHTKWHKKNKPLNGEI